MSVMNRGTDSVSKAILNLPNAPVNALDVNKRTPLHFAASCGNIEAMKMLLKRNVDPNCESTSGRSPLHDAALEGKKNAVSLLLANGASVNKRDKKGDTAAHLAVHNSHMDVAEELILQGANFDVTNHQGNSVTELVKSKGGAGKNLLLKIVEHKRQMEKEKRESMYEAELRNWKKVRIGEQQ